MDREEIYRLMGKLGINLDNTQEDRERFSALIDLMAEFAREEADMFHAEARSFNWWKETAEEFLVG